MHGDTLAILTCQRLAVYTNDPCIRLPGVCVHPQCLFRRHRYAIGIASFFSLLFSNSLVAYANRR